MVDVKDDKDNWTDITCLRNEHEEWLEGKAIKLKTEYVFSNRGLLIHKIASAKARWWDITGYRGRLLVRLKRPHISITTNCGRNIHATSWRAPGKWKATLCVLPKPDAVMCGKCNGELPTFGKHSKIDITKPEARRRLGCVIEEAG